MVTEFYNASDLVMDGQRRTGADGRCEQRVESCAMWSRDVVVHDRPRWAQ